MKLSISILIAFLFFGLSMPSLSHSANFSQIFKSIGKIFSKNQSAIIVGDRLAKQEISKRKKEQVKRNNELQKYIQNNGIKQP